MNAQKSSTEDIYKNMTVIWFALFSSQLLFLFVIYMAKPGLFNLDFSNPLLGDDAMMVAMFGALSLILLVSSFVMEKKFMDRAIAEQKPPVLQTAMITGCAMCEAISLFGLVLAFSHSYQYFFLWIALAMAGMAFHFPSRRGVMDATSSQNPA